jgi:Protein of unknown function (DUF3040)
MPLSENEQRLLEQIERALVQDDPKFASAVRATHPRTYLLRRIRRSTLVFVLGLVVLVVGVGLNDTPYTITLGIVGFLLMLLAALRGAADIRRMSGRTETGRGGATPVRRSRPRHSFRERVEERWRRRWEDRGM